MIKEEEKDNVSTTRMGLGRVKRKREKILLEKQTLTSTKEQLYRLGCYIEATVQYLVFYRWLLLHYGEPGRDTLFIRKDYSKWKTTLQADTIQQPPFQTCT